MSFSFQIANSVSEIGQLAWDEIGKQRAFGSYQWYQFGEAVLDDSPPVYIIVSKDGHPVGRATFWIVKDETLSDMKGFLWRVLQVGIKALLRARPLLICRSPLSNTSGLILPDTPDRKAVLDEITRAAKSEAERRRCSFVIFDQLQPAEYDNPDWSPEVLKYDFPGPASVMNIKRQSFDDYLNSLTKKTRKNYRRYVRYAEDKNMVIRELRHPSEAQLLEAKQLFLNVEERHNPIPTSWFDRVLPRFQVIGGVLLAAEIDGRMVGCELLLRDGDDQYVPAIGLDYAAPNTYFLLGYADIRFAIEQGVHRLHWGMGTFDVKRRMGFEQEFNNYIVYFGIGTIGRVVERLSAAFL